VVNEGKRHPEQHGRAGKSPIMIGTKRDDNNDGDNGDNK
jgi:hypothetical protein